MSCFAKDMLHGAEKCNYSVFSAAAFVLERRRLAESTNNEKCCLFLLVFLTHLKAFSIRGRELHFNVVVQKMKTG